MLTVVDQRAAPLFRGVERNVGKDFFHDRVQPPSPDVLGAGVHVFREGRDFPQAVIQLEFSEAPQESITIQQANEAEAPVNEAD